MCMRKMLHSNIAGTCGVVVWAAAFRTGWFAIIVGTIVCKLTFIKKKLFIIIKGKWLDRDNCSTSCIFFFPPHVHQQASVENIFKMQHVYNVSTRGDQVVILLLLKVGMWRIIFYFKDGAFFIVWPCIEEEKQQRQDTQRIVLFITFVKCINVSKVPVQYSLVASRSHSTKTTMLHFWNQSLLTRL